MNGFPLHPTRRIVYSASFSGNFQGSFWGCVRLFGCHSGGVLGGIWRETYLQKSEKLPKPYLLLFTYLALGSLFTEWDVPGDAGSCFREMLTTFKWQPVFFGPGGRLGGPGGGFPCRSSGCATMTTTEATTRPPRPSTTGTHSGQKNTGCQIQVERDSLSIRSFWGRVRLFGNNFGGVFEGMWRKTIPTKKQIQNLFFTIVLALIKESLQK